MAPPLIGLARAADAGAIVAVRDAAADALTEPFGAGHWSSHASASTVRASLRNPKEWVVVSRIRGRVGGTLALQTKKPWAIDVSYFTPVSRPLYLVNMAVLPKQQGRKIGRRLLDFAVDFAKKHGFGAIRLDSYDAPAGAGGFYERCGFELRGKVKYKGNPLRYYEILLGATGTANEGSTQRTQRRGGRGGRARK